MTNTTKTAALPRMSTPHYVPKVGDTITITLPDEVTRGEIEKVISDEAVIARLLTFTMAVGKSHNYRKGNLVPCRFTKLGMGNMGWETVSQREMDEAVSAKATRKKGK